MNDIFWRKKIKSDAFWPLLRSADHGEFSIEFSSIMSPESELVVVFNWLIRGRPDNYKKLTVEKQNYKVFIYSSHLFLIRNFEI